MAKPKFKKKLAGFAREVAEIKARSAKLMKPLKAFPKQVASVSKRARRGEA